MAGLHGPGGERPETPGSSEGAGLVPRRRPRGGRPRAPGDGLRALALAAAVAAASSCEAPPTARAFRVTDRVQLVGGPAALGELGDFVIENDRIRAVVLQGGNSVGPGMFGGTLVDLDLRRPEASHSAGRGNDQFSELFPMANLIIPGYADEGGPGIGDLEVSIWSDGRDGRCPLGPDEAPEGCAAIRVSGHGDRIIDALGTIALLQVPMQMSFVTYYALRPGDPYVVVRTFFWDPSKWTIPAGLAGEADEPAELARLAADGGLSPIEQPAPIFESLVGNALDQDPPECTDGPCYRHPGYLAGDFLMLGGKLSVFGTSAVSSGAEADRSGFEIGYLFQRRYDRGEVVLSAPLADDVVLGIGDRVSYGYTSARGTVSIPIMTGTFTGAFTHAYQCVTSGPEEDCREALRRPMMYDRYLVVGEGDAASVLEVYYELRGLPTGALAGHVLDEVSGEPLAGAQVFALLDPRYPREGPADESIDVGTYDSLRAALLASTGGDAGIVSHATVDRGLDRVPDASWSMRLEPGRYLLVAFLAGRRPGRPVPVHVEEGSSRTLSLALPPAGRLRFEVVDERGDNVAAKLTVIGPLDDEAECPSEGLAPDLSSLAYLELGSSETPHGIAKVVYTAEGEGVLELAPGRYDVIASRGFEYSIDRQCVTVRQDTTPIEHFSVLREVDTSGWVAGDFHVHGVNSYDANVRHELRIVTAVAEGLEVFATTDHDYLTNLEPVVADLDMRDQVSTIVGLEVTTIETGHMLGFPLRFDETRTDNGALDWSRRDRCLEDRAAFGCPGNPSGFMALTPQETFDELRDLGEFGPEHTVVVVPHPRDGFFGYFDQFHLNHFDLRLDPAGIVAGQSPLLAEYTGPGNRRFRLYSENFDAIELFNGRRYEMVRTPTVSEVTSFVGAFARARQEATTEEDFARRLTEVHQQAMRRILLRTPEEQAALRMTRALECAHHEDCPAGEICDPHRYECVDEMPACESDDDCFEACVERSRCSSSGEVCTGDDDCLGEGESCAAATECATLATPCTTTADCRLACEGGECRSGELACETDADCPGRWEYSCERETGTCRPNRPSCTAQLLPCPPGTYCESTVFLGREGGRCLAECESDLDCRGDEYCYDVPGQVRSCRIASCNIGSDAMVVPEAEWREGPDRPCVRGRDPLSEGIVDDWFRLLNHGIAYTGMANSDSHTTASEIGMPRSFVMSSTDAPAMISRREIADNIRAFRVVSSFGPFVELSTAGGVIGDTVAASGPVELRVRVQSASWFDVDRIEVYGNGELVCELGHGASEASRCETDAVLAVGPDGQNTDIVNFDGVIVDRPSRDTWYVVIAMGVGEGARGLAPVYPSTIHPSLGFTEVIGQAFASFDVALLRAVIPSPVQRPELNAMIPYAVTNPIWVEVDGDGVFTPPMGIPAYRRQIPCQFARDSRGCPDVEIMPLSSESVGRSPLVLEPDEDGSRTRSTRVMMIRRALMRLIG